MILMINYILTRLFRHKNSFILSILYTNYLNHYWLMYSERTCWILTLNYVGVSLIYGLFIQPLTYIRDEHERQMYSWHYASKPGLKAKCLETRYYSMQVYERLVYASFESHVKYSWNHVFNGQAKFSIIDSVWPKIYLIR